MRERVNGSAIEDPSVPGLGEALTNDHPVERSIIQTFSDARPVFLI